MAVERLVRARQLVQNRLQEPVRIGCGDEYAAAIDHANHEMPDLESLRLDNIAQGNTQFGEREISRDDPGHLPMPAHGFGDDDAGLTGSTAVMTTMPTSNTGLLVFKAL